MWQYLQMGLICLGVCFGGSGLAIAAMFAMAEADQANPRPPRGGHRVRGAGSGANGGLAATFDGRVEESGVKPASTPRPAV